MSLSQYIIESLTKFDSFTDSFDDLLNKCKRLRCHKDPELIRSFIDDIKKDSGYTAEEMFIYAIEAPYFKIPYAYTESIIRVIGKYEGRLKMTLAGSKKVKISWKDGGEVFETGSGSIGRVSTAQQESATVIIWNRWREEMVNGGWFDLSDKVFIKNVVSDITAGFDSEWILTFGKQVMLISDYLKSIDVNPLDYKMCRYGDDEVGRTYEKYISAYVKEIGGQKDNFDPSDVIVYDEKRKGDIISKLRSYVSDPVKSKSMFIEELFNTKLLQGLSLKKIVGNSKGIYERFNVCDGNNRIGRVSGYEIMKNSGDKQIVLICSGAFRFDGVTDPDDGEEMSNGKKIKVVMRGFGSGQTGVDCMTREVKGNRAPSLGKCPARVWRAIIGVDGVKELGDNIKYFYKYLNNNKLLVCKGLEEIIKGAIKEGPSCFPFILIH